MTTNNIISKLVILIVLTLPALTGCTWMGLADVEAFTVGVATVTPVVVAADINKDSNVKIYGNYNDDHGYWLDKDKFHIYVEADSQDESERIARVLSSESCEKRGRFFSILKIQNDQLAPPSVSIFDDKYSTEIQFTCTTTEKAKLEPSSIFVTTEDQDNSVRLARELANESCQNRSENISIIKIDSYLRPVSLLVLDMWYATDITFSCNKKTTEENILETN